MQSKYPIISSLSGIVVILILISSATADILTFQQGVDGYDRAQDTAIRLSYTVNYGDTPDFDMDHPGDAGNYEMQSTNGGASTVLEAGQFFQRVLGSIGSGRSTVEAGPTYRYARFFIRFRDIFGTGANQIPADAPIKAATLKLYNTEDLGSAKAAGAAYFGDEVTLIGTGGLSTRVPNVVGQPKLNAATIGVYPLLTSIKFGNNDGTANKGVATGGEKRRGKEQWSRGQMCIQEIMNDPFAVAANCGPAPLGDPDVAAGAQAEYDPNHAGAIEAAQDITEGFKSFDVTDLMDFVGGDGLYVIGLSPPNELPTLDINYGQAYRSSEFGSTAAEIATRPMLVVEFIPEPATFAIIGLGSLILLRRRRVS